MSVQVPLAVTLDLVLRRPPWLQHASSVVLMLTGTACVLAGFFGVNLANVPAQKQGGSTLAVTDSGDFETGTQRQDTALQEPQTAAAAPA